MTPSAEFFFSPSLLRYRRAHLVVKFTATIASPPYCSHQRLLLAMALLPSLLASPLATLSHRAWPSSPEPAIAPPHALPQWPGHFGEALVLLSYAITSPSRVDAHRPAYLCRWASIMPGRCLTIATPIDGNAAPFTSLPQLRTTADPRWTPEPVAHACSTATMPSSSIAPSSPPLRHGWRWASFATLAASSLCGSMRELVGITPVP
jgi:hypothetical protein